MLSHYAEAGVVQSDRVGVRHVWSFTDRGKDACQVGHSLTHGRHLMACRALSPTLQLTDMTNYELLRQLESQGFSAVMYSLGYWKFIKRQTYIAGETKDVFLPSQGHVDRK